LRWGGGKVIILIILPALQGLHGEEKLELAEKLDSLFRGNDKQRRRGGNKMEPDHQNYSFGVEITDF